VKLASTSPWKPAGLFLLAGVAWQGEIHPMSIAGGTAQSTLSFSFDGESQCGMLADMVFLLRLCCWA